MDTQNSDLAKRLESEKAFHDAKYGTNTGYPAHYKANPTAQIYERMRDQLGDLRDKTLLEYGCGEGWITRDLAMRGARVHAFDISDEGVKNTTAVLQKANLADRCVIEQMAAEKLTYPSESFDMSVGFAILHHLDMPRALAELHRVLKPGGIAVFAEPLGTNPLINLYRNMTPQYRTVDETPLVLKDFRKMVTNFSHFSHQEYYFTALAALAMLYVPILNKAYKPMNRLLTRFDDWCLPKVGPLRNLAWYSIIVLKK